MPFRQRFAAPPSAASLVGNFGLSLASSLLPLPGRGSEDTVFNSVPAGFSAKLPTLPPRPALTPERALLAPPPQVRVEHPRLNSAQHLRRRDRKSTRLN